MQPLVHATIADLDDETLLTILRSLEVKDWLAVTGLNRSLHRCGLQLVKEHASDPITLITAAVTGHVAGCRAALDGRTTVEGASQFYGQPMEVATETGHTEVVIFLMDRLLAEVEHPWQEFEPYRPILEVLEDAASRGHVDIVKHVLDVGQRTEGCWLASIQTGGRQSYVHSGPLGRAAYHGHARVVELLLMAGFHASVALQSAVAGGNLAILCQLLAAVTPQDLHGDGRKDNALYLAIMDAKGEMVRELINAGADSISEW